MIFTISGIQTSNYDFLNIANLIWPKLMLVDGAGGKTLGLAHQAHVLPLKLCFSKSYLSISLGFL